MRAFRTLIVLKRPQQEMWALMRDHLVDLSAGLTEIRGIRELQRTLDSEGTVHIVNEWRAHEQIPPAIRAMLKIDEVSWIDRNSWNASTRICRWAIEPQFLADSIACSGETSFSEAMGGRGTRIALAGELEVRPSLLASLGNIGPTVSGLIETIIRTVVPNNLRAVAEAAAAFGLPNGETSQ